MDLITHQEAKAGRITLNRPKALNALTYEMCLGIEEALDKWRDDDAVQLIIIDAAGDRAFCSGGDIAEMYATGTASEYAYGRKFWRDEYRMNAKIADYPKPIVSFLHGFVMGGGVGVACHAGHRIVGESAQVAMPECGIGLVPDVGGSYLLARAPGRVGEYLGLTATRMGPADAIYAGFADSYVPEDQWDALKTALCEAGDEGLISNHSSQAPEGELHSKLDNINRNFAGETLGDIVRALKSENTDFATDALKRLSRNSPLSMACTVEMLHRLRATPNIHAALELEYRFTHRSMEHSDFLEGIRAAIIDKDRNPKWRHQDAENVPQVDVSKMLMPLGQDALNLKEELS